MANYQEILTKAVVGKGTKTTIDDYTLTPNLKPTKVLGCWVINHSLKPILNNNEVYIEGEYEVHIWYAYDEDKNTELHKEKITYNELIPFKMKRKEELTTKLVLLFIFLFKPYFSKEATISAFLVLFIFLVGFNFSRLSIKSFSITSELDVKPL